MAKQSWRERETKGASPAKKTKKVAASAPAKKGAGWNAAPASGSKFVSTRKAMLAVLFIGGCVVIAAFVWYLRPAKKTPLTIIASGKLDGEQLLFRSNPFKSETLAWFERDLTQSGDIALRTNRDSKIQFKLLDTLGSDDAADRAFADLRLGGPNKDVALFYLYANGMVSSETPYLLTEASKLDQPSSWIPFADILKRFADNNRLKNSKVILFLDCGRSSPQLDRKALFSDFPSRAGGLVTEAIANGTLGEDFHLVVSNSDHQKSWTATELNSSVFGFFVANGLQGWADIDRDQTVSFKELAVYLSNQVSDWAQDFRDSNQFVSVYPGTENATDFPVVYAYNRVDPTPVKVERLKKDIDAMWIGLANARQRYLRQYPLTLAQLECEMIRLEELQNEPGSNPEYSQLFSECGQEMLIRFSKTARGLGSQSYLPVSLAEKIARRQLNKNVTSNDIETLKRILKREANQAIPEKKASEQTNESESSGETPKNDQPAENPTKPKADDSIGEKQLAEEGELLSWGRDSFASVVWRLFLEAESNVTQENVQRCLALLEQDRRQGSSSVLVEMQFLQLLLENIDWKSKQLDAVGRRSVWEAIRCRNSSERLIQQFAEPRNLVGWRFVKDDFEKIEAARRHCEDLLLAGAFQDSIETFKRSPITANKDLRSEYETLQRRAEEIANAQSLAEESLWVLPHITSFLSKEQLLKASSSQLKSPESLKEMFEIANRVFVAFVETDTKFDFQKHNLEMTQGLSVWRNFLASYCKLDKPDFSESETLRAQQHLLESPLVEWIKTDPSLVKQVWDRKSIRVGIEKAKTRQADSFFVSRYWDPETKEISISDSIKTEARSRADLPPLIPSLQVEDRLNGTQFMDLNSLLARSDLWSDDDASKYESILEALQTTNEDKGTAAGLSSRRDQLLQIDLLNRYMGARGVLGKALRSKDVGPRLAMLQTHDWNASRVARSIKDFWGSGMVNQYDSDTQKPPFLKLAEAYRSFGAGVQPIDESWLPDSSNKAELDSSQLRDLRFKMTKFKSDPSGTFKVPYLAENTVVDLETTIDGIKSLLAMAGDDLSIGSVSLLDNRQVVDSQLSTGQQSATVARLHAMPLNAISLENQFSLGVNLGNTKAAVSQRDLRFAFRGHQLTSRIELQKQITLKPTVTIYSTSLVKKKNNTSEVKVSGPTKEISDVMLILDCSKSMNAAGLAGVNEGGGAVKGNSRLTNAKLALRELSRDLEKTGRFRVGLMAFSHRSSFLEQKESGKFLYAGPVHPFYDSEIVFPLSSSKEATSNADFRKIRNSISEIGEGLGSTPLYYSILKAAEKLMASKNENPKQLVVLTDGINFQGQGSRAPEGGREVTIDGSNGGENFSRIWAQKYKDIKLHLVLMNPSNLPFSKYLASKLASLKTDAVNNEARIRFTEEIELTRYPKLERWVKENTNVSLMEAKDGDTNDVKKKMLMAIRFVKYSVASANENRPTKTSLGESVTLKIPESKQDMVVTMHDTIRPSQKSLTLVGGERIDFEFDRDQGLRFRGYENEFVDAKRNVTVGSSDYTIGRLPERVEFGIQASEHASNGTAKPARVWAEVIPRTKDGTLQRYFVFDYQFKSAQRIPIIEFPSLKEMNQRIVWPIGQKTADIRLWISEIAADPKAGTQLAVGKSYANIDGFSCSSTLTNGIVTVVVSTADSAQNASSELDTQHVVTCSSSKATKRTFEYANGKPTKVIHEFKLESLSSTSPPNLVLYRRRKDDALEESLRTTDKGIAKDPFFGSPATWVKFLNVPIVE